MRFSLAVSAALVASVVASVENSAPADGAVTTEVLTAYTTYCPEPTTITHGTQTYTVTEPTTLTITGPCTITRPIMTSIVTECNDCPIPTPPPASSTGVIPRPTETPVYPVNSTAIIPGPTATGTGIVPPPPPFNNAGNTLVAGTGAGLAGILGLAALLL